MAQFHEIDSSQFSDVVPDGSEKIQIGATKRTNLQNIADLFDVFSHLKAGSNISLKKESDGTVTITANDQSYTLPKASSSVLGGIKVGKNLTIDSGGVLSANDQSYTLPKASSSVLGGVKVPGSNPISVDGTGNLSLKYSTTFGLNYISGYLGLSLFTVPWTYSGFGADLKGFNLKERQFIFWLQSVGSSVTVTINLSNSDWNMMGMSIISIGSSTNEGAAINLQISGGSAYFMGEGGNTSSKQINNIVKYSAIVFKLITISNSKRILVIPIPRA